MKYILKQVESQKSSKLRSETELKYYNILFYMPPPEIVKTWKDFSICFSFFFSLHSLLNTVILVLYGYILLKYLFILII